MQALDHSTAETMNVCTDDVLAGLALNTPFEKHFRRSIIVNTTDMDAANLRLENFSVRKDADPTRRDAGVPRLRLRSP